jgi:hypothetical protein
MSLACSFSVTQAGATHPSTMCLPWFMEQESCFVSLKQFKGMNCILAFIIIRQKVASY